MTPPASPADVPFERGTMRMGLSPIPASAWLECGEDAALQMPEKARLLATRRGDVLAALPGSDDAAEEALELMLATLRRHHPDRIGPAALDAVNAARTVGADHPLAVAAKLVQEDACLLQPARDTYRLTAGCVCFPSNWSLREKLGRPLAEIHAPVPGYAATLAAPVDRLFDRLAPGHLVARLNWLIHDNAELHQHGRTPDPPRVTPGNAGDVLWLRTERQVLQRLPRTGAVLFTIRTRLHRLRDSVATPEKAAELAAALRAMPPDLQAYRHMQPFAAPLLAWLDGMASGGEAERYCL